MSKEEIKWTTEEVAEECMCILAGLWEDADIHIELWCGEPDLGSDCVKRPCDEVIILYDGCVGGYSKDDAFFKAVDEGWTARQGVDEDIDAHIVWWLCPKCSDPNFKWPADCYGGEG